MIRKESVNEVVSILDILWIVLIKGNDLEEINRFLFHKIVQRGALVDERRSPSCRRREKRSLGTILWLYFRGVFSLNIFE